MQESMETYRNNTENIESFLIETINNVGSFSQREDSNFVKLFEVFPSLELVYICDTINIKQISENIYRKKTTRTQIGNSRKYLLNKVIFNESNIAISQPYISSATGDTCITVVKKEEDKYYFLDFTVTTLLKRLGLIEIHKEFNLMSKGFYFITAVVMIILALFTVGYALFSFINSLFFEVDISIDSIFKPVIALTLGLAIFDLAKTILEQEVVFKSYSKNSKAEYRVLIKFSITIIIALLIEALMVVFKIAIADYSQMIHAVYLIGGVALLIISLGLFIYYTKKKI